MSSKTIKTISSVYLNNIKLPTPYSIETDVDKIYFTAYGVKLGTQVIGKRTKLLSKDNSLIAEILWFDYNPEKEIKLQIFGEYEEDSEVYPMEFTMHGCGEAKIYRWNLNLLRNRLCRSKRMNILKLKIKIQVFIFILILVL